MAVDNKLVERLAAEVREQNSLYEAGESDTAFWLGQQARLRAMSDAGLSHSAISKKVGKSRDWVSDVLKWDRRILPTPWAGPRGEKREASTARKVLREHPELVADEIRAAAKALSKLSEFEQPSDEEVEQAVSVLTRAEPIQQSEAQIVLSAAREDARLKQAQERKAVDPEKEKQSEEMRSKFKQEDLAHDVLRWASRIRIDVISILNAVKNYDGEIAGSEDVERARDMMRRSAERLAQAADALDELATVDIDKLVAQLTEEG